MENRFKLARTLHNQHGSQSTKEVESGSGITKSLIEDLESNAGKPRNVSYLKVKRLAEHYGVSSDYLLGLSPTPSVDEDIQAVCKFTGLSKEVVSILNKADSDELDFISFLIVNRISQNVSSAAYGCAIDKRFVAELDEWAGTVGVNADNLQDKIGESDEVRKASNEVVRLKERIDMRLWRCHKTLESAIESFVDHILEEAEKDGQH